MRISDWSSDVCSSDLTGRPDEGDRRLTVIRAPSFGIVGDQLTLTLRVDDLPAAAAGGSARVMLRQDGVATQSIDARVGVEEEKNFKIDRDRKSTRLHSSH